MGGSGPSPAGQGTENLGEKHDLTFRDSHLAPTSLVVPTSPSYEADQTSLLGSGFPMGNRCSHGVTHQPWGSWDILLGSRFRVASPNMEKRYRFLPLQRKWKAGAPPRKQESGLVERRVSCRVPQRQESGDIWGCQLGTSERLWRKNPARRPCRITPTQGKGPAPQISSLLVATLGSVDQSPVVPPSNVSWDPAQRGVHGSGAQRLGWPQGSGKALCDRLR